jgi:chitodextrinase
LNQLLAWHIQDPVSPREIARNNAIYARQNNRNPFIDNPQYVNAIWKIEAVDTEAPTAATSLTVTSTTSNSASLSWTAATDNVAVTGYDIYVNGNFKTTETGLTATVTGLAASTAYSFYIVTRDAERNSSVPSSTVQGITKDAAAGTTSCASEDFQTIPANATSYTTQTWTNGQITWTATDARTDQTLNATRAITIRNGSLTSTAVSNGIADLTVTTQLTFSGSAGTFKLNVNGIEVGSIPYSTAITTTTIPGINVTGNVVISITGNSSTSNRVKFDDLSWTCAPSLGVNQLDGKSFTIYPNPSNGNVKINFTNSIEKRIVQVFSVLGQKVFENEYANSSSVVIANLPIGVYIVKVTENAKSVSKKLIIK